MNTRISKRVSSSIPAVLAGTVLIIQCVGTPAYGADEATSGSECVVELKLDSLISLALKQNPTLQAANFEAESKQAQIGPSGALDDPMLALEAMNYPVEGFSARKFEMTGNQISITQRLPFPGKREKLRRSAEFEFQSSEENIRAERLELIKQIKLNFLQLYLSQRSREILSEERIVLDGLITLSRNRYTVGQAPESDLLNLQVEEARLAAKIIGFELEIAEQKVKLSSLIGIERGACSFSGAAQKPKQTLLDFSPGAEDRFTAGLFDKNPGIRAAQFALESRSSLLSYAQAGYLPDFELRAAYTIRESEDEGRGSDFVSGGIGLTIPIWAGEKQREQIKASAAESLTAGARLREKKNELNSLTRAIFSRLREGDKRLRLFKEQALPLAKQAVVSGEASYVTSAAQFSSLLDAVSRRFELEIESEQAIVNYESQIAELEALRGTEMRGDL